MFVLIEPITPEKDAKLKTLKERLALPPLKIGKRLIFTQYADTARYLFENLNPQDCDKIINYGLHWNPVRLIQRFGRIDRIGSDHDIIYGFNFLPETGIERNLGLREKLHNST